MKPIDDVYYVVRTGRPATLEQYDRFQAATERPGSATGASREPVAKIDGLGAASYVSAFMGARWSFDALIHVVGATDIGGRAPTRFPVDRASV